jgi:hypothetical protein
VSSWEYKEIRVALGISAKAAAGPGISKDMAVRQAAINAASQATPKITSALRVEGADGWEPDQATDLFSLLHAGQVVWRQTGGLLFSWKFTFDSAVIRFRRSVSAAPEGTTPARFCAQCGSPRDGQDRFCAVCGAPFHRGL